MALLDQATLTLIGHNIQRHDIPLMTKSWSRGSCGLT
jgi:hypothetical protein